MLSVKIIKKIISARLTYINTSSADVCILEHEFGIYGGESGIYILPLINRLEKPLISILHTILKDPSYVQRIIIREIAEQSSKICNEQACGGVFNNHL
jgi:hypothetical protein